MGHPVHNFFVPQIVSSFQTDVSIPSAVHLLSRKRIEIFQWRLRRYREIKAPQLLQAEVITHSIVPTSYATITVRYL